MSSPEPGDRLGPYRLLRELGEGGMGRVLLAEHPRRGRVCVKILPAHRRENFKSRRRFRREAEAARRLRHPNIVRAWGLEEYDDTTIIVQEYVSGGDLTQLLESRGALSPPEALRLTRDIAEGLVVAHRAGFVHRDLKPDNILLDSDGHPRIADFGLVLQVGGDPVDGQTILTVSGRALGSPGYIAPEQWRDAHSVDARADHYSLGIMLHEMLTGRHPMAELKTMTEVMQAHLERPLPPIPGVDKSIMAFIAWLTEKDPADRPADAVRVLARLDELCAVAGDAPERKLRVKVTPTGRLRRGPGLDAPELNGPGQDGGTEGGTVGGFVGLDAYAPERSPSRKGSDRPDRHATLDLADQDSEEDGSAEVVPALFGSEDSRPIFAEAPESRPPGEPAPAASRRRPPTIKVRRHEDSDRVRVREPAPEPTPARTDTTLAADAIEKLERVGEGGMGIVWRVHDRRLGREAALKVVRGGAGDAERRRRRFLREARITATLSHPAIPPIYETGQTPEGDDYILMKLIEGETLRERIQALHSGPVVRSELVDLLEVLVKVAEAIAFAHSRGIIHRDLKPHNIMVGAFGEVMVLDWGLARAPGPLDDSSLDGDKVELDTEELSLLEDARAAGLTISGSVIGTPGYAAPEQLDGRSDHRSDVFALGALLIEILTGHAAIPGRTPIECIAATLEGRRRESRRSAAIAPEFYALAEAALAHSPERRLPDAELFVRELRAAIAGEDSGLMRTNPLRRASRLIARNPLPIAVASLLTLLALGLAFFAFTSQRIRREAHRAELAEQAVLARDGARRELDELIAAVSRGRATGVSVAEACDPLLRTFADAPHERLRIARLLADAGLRDRAVALLSELRDEALTAPDPAARPAAARALFELHRLELQTLPLDAFAMTPALTTLLARPADEVPSGLLLYARAWRALAKGERLDARRWLSRLDAGPDWIPVDELQARSRLDRPEDALTILDPAIARGGEPLHLARLLLVRAKLHREAERLVPALADLTALTVLRPDALPALTRRAAVLEALGQDEEALAAWRAVIARHPEDPEAFRRLRRLLVARGNLESALRELDKQLSLQPSPELHAQRAGICDRLFQWPEALRSWSLALERAPDAPALRLGRARTRRALLESLRRAPTEDELETIRADLQRAAEAIDPAAKAAALRLLAAELIRAPKPTAADLRAASTALTEACQVEPENPRNAFELAGVELARGGLPKARTALTLANRRVDNPRTGPSATLAALIRSQRTILDRLGPADKPHAHIGLLDELTLWDAATRWQRLDVARQVEARIGARDWRFVDCRAFRCQGQRHHVAIFQQVLTDEVFHLIPGGPARLGLKNADSISSAREDMPETAALRLKPFLIARDELTRRTVAQLLATQDINALVATRPAALSLAEVRKLLTDSRFGLRLPGEHEWEYAARAGSRDRFPWGPAFDARRAWYQGNAGGKAQSRELRPDAFNAFGLSDVIGNLAEWALESRDGRSPKTPRAPILRGGSFRDDAEDLRVTRRQSRGASPRGGLRPVRDL